MHPQKLRTAALEIREMKTVCPLRPGLSSEGHAEAGVGKEKGASVLVRSTYLAAGGRGLFDLEFA